MNRDVDAAAPIVDNLDHLLEGPLLNFSRRRSDGHTHQSAKLADTMVNVYHIVANLELLNLLQRKRHLTATCLVALKIVLVETVKDLMVSKDADMKVVVDEAFVQGILNRNKRGNGRQRMLTAHLSKDIPQSFILFLTVCTYIYLIAFRQIVFKRLLEQVEVLVEEWLGRNMEVERREFGTEG